MCKLHDPTLVVLRIIVYTYIYEKSKCMNAPHFLPESVKLTRILDLNDTVDEHQDSVSEMPSSTVTPQPVTSTYETVVGHHETQGNNASEYEKVVSHSLSVPQSVAHGPNQYACVATEAVHGLVYSIVPAQVRMSALVYTDTTPCI